jgi:hypothetical protein
MSSGCTAYLFLKNKFIIKIKTGSYMKKISSSTTQFNKKIFPAIWFSTLSLFIIFPVISTLRYGTQAISFIIFPLLMGFFGFFIMKKTVFDLMDEVYDAGDYLLVKNKNKEIRINLMDIKNLSYSIFARPCRVTLNLLTDTAFGKTIAFSPKMSFIPFKKNAEIMELINRIDKVRRFKEYK